MSTPALTTRLDAVNTILTACGESPVSSLADTTADTANAVSVLDEVLRDVQTEGWHFNTEKEVPFTPDTDGLINLPGNVAKIDLSAVDTQEVDNGTSSLFPSQGRFATLLAKGTWGGALLTVEASPDGGTTWITTTVQMASDGVMNFIAGKGVSYRASLTGATGATNLSAWLAYEA